MGLDMYLRRTKKVQNPEEVTYSNSESVHEWRKFNALHKWFVENCQDGVDECQYSFVTKERLISLLAILEQLTPENCSELFPTEYGFFFGTTEYGDRYWNNVNETKDLLHELIENFDWENASLCYHSSW